MGGERVGSLDTTSRYSWYYGLFPWSNNPADGGPRQVYDDSRLMLDSTLPAGSKIRLQVDTTDTAPWYAIDLADFEHVEAPTAAPIDALSIIDYGADPNGGADSTDAIQTAIDAATGTGRTVWIPEGRFTVTRHLIVDDVTVKGAGPWYSVLTGDGVGVYGNFAPTPSTNVHLADFAIFGEVNERVDNDQINAIGGALGDSTIDNLWLQHTKVGMWLDGPFDNLKITRVRILDQTADGLNFHNGVTNSSVSDTYVRNTGDDGLAMWSEVNPNSGNTFTRNTVKVPVLANNIAIYGGQDITVSDNWVTDTVTQGGGIQIANRFGATPLSGTNSVTGNHLERTGTLDLFTHIGNGALTFWAGDTPMNGAVNVSRNTITDSAYSAVQFLGKEITNINAAGNVLDGAGTFAVQLNAPGSATFSNTTAVDLGSGGIFDCESGFVIVDAGGNTGWDTRTCAAPSPGPLDVSDAGDELMFSTSATGTTSAPQTVTIHNPTASAQPIASVTATGSYTLTTTCPAELEPGTSCEATLTFAPTATGDRNGSLTVSDGTSAGRYQVYLRGDVFTTTGNLAFTRPAVASSETSGCCTATNTTDGLGATYWESTNDKFPQTLTVDFGRAVAVDTIKLTLPPGWGTRTQTLQILASPDNETFSPVIPSGDYVFNPDVDNNTVTIDFPTTTTARYLRAEVTGNTEWPAAQIAEFEAYNQRTPEPTLTPTPAPTQSPTPTNSPTVTPTQEPTTTPTQNPTVTPTQKPTVKPTSGPVDVYATPGYHFVNGRHWFTACEKYSQTTRCRTSIMATTVKRINSHFVSTHGWVFNNLTYLPSPRPLWKNNPLGRAGVWTATDGRRWSTECDTPVSGRNGCRSYIWSQSVKATRKPSGWTYAWEWEWTFNNIVRFN